MEMGMEMEIPNYCDHLVISRSRNGKVPLKRATVASPKVLSRVTWSSCRRTLPTLTPRSRARLEEREGQLHVDKLVEEGLLQRQKRVTTEDGNIIAITICLNLTLDPLYRTYDAMNSSIVISERLQSVHHVPLNREK